jgi:hypothetical protein
MIFRMYLVSPLKFWQVSTKTGAALGYGLVHSYFGNALNLRLYPLPSPQIKLLQAITACCMEYHFFVMEFDWFVV